MPDFRDSDDWFERVSYCLRPRTLRRECAIITASFDSGLHTGVVGDAGNDLVLPGKPDRFPCLISEALMMTGSSGLALFESTNFEAGVCDYHCLVVVGVPHGGCWGP